MNEKIQELMDSPDFEHNKVGLAMLEQLTFGECYDILKKVYIPTMLDYDLGKEFYSNIILISLFDTLPASLHFLKERKSRGIWSMESEAKVIRVRCMTLPQNIKVNLDTEVAVQWLEEVMGVTWWDNEMPGWEYR